MFLHWTVVHATVLGHFSVSWRSSKCLHAEEANRWNDGVWQQFKLRRSCESISWKLWVQVAKNLHGDKQKHYRSAYTHSQNKKKRSRTLKKNHKFQTRAQKKTLFDNRMVHVFVTLVPWGFGSRSTTEDAEIQPLWQKLIMQIFLAVPDLLPHWLWIHCALTALTRRFLINSGSGWSMALTSESVALSGPSSALDFPTCLLG